MISSNSPEGRIKSTNERAERTIWLVRGWMVNDTANSSDDWKIKSQKSCACERAESKRGQLVIIHKQSPSLNSS